MIGETYEEDALTRDFTMNALYFDVLSRKIIDPMDGAKDISSRTIRPILDDCDFIFSDKVRVIRALRLACCLNFELSSDISSHFRNIDDKHLFNSMKVGKLEYQKILSTNHLFSFLSRLIEFELIWHYPYNINFKKFNHSSYIKRLLTIASKH